MIAPATQPAATADPPAAIDDFARAMCGRNPFARNQVGDAGDAEVDVPSIHGEAFFQLVRRVEQVRSAPASVGVMVVGGAGVGKSHLLARLARWAGQDGRAAIVFLQDVGGAPDRMSRHLLHATVRALAACRGQAHHESELYRLLSQAIGAQLRPYGRIRVPSLMLQARTLEHLGREADPGGDVSRVLVRYLRAAAPEGQGRPGAHALARHAVDWLAGEAIGPDAAAQLGLHADGDEAARDERVDQVFRALSHLGGIAERPLLLCIDQVDHLDDDAARALAAFLHGLLDGARHLLVALSGEKQGMNRFVDGGVIPQVAWDRLAEYTIELDRIDGRQARALVAARLDHFTRRFRGLAELEACRGDDALFPLGERWLEDRFRRLIDLRPRDVLSWSRDRWEEQQAALERRGWAAWLASWSRPSEPLLDEPVAEPRVLFVHPTPTPPALQPRNCR
jgi:hypothetical protein